MAKYIAHRIEGGHLDYTRMITLYPKYKEEIDRILTEEGYAYLIVNTEDNNIEINGEKITINNECISIAA